jgi:hypothetical protein
MDGTAGSARASAEIQYHSIFWRAGTRIDLQAIDCSQRYNIHRADAFGLSAKSGISQNGLCQNQWKAGHTAEKLFLGSTYDEGIRI